MAAGDTTSKNGVAATAFQYDQSSDPVKTPAACIPDGYNGKFGNSRGHKVMCDGTTGKYAVYPQNGDWIVTAGGKVFVMDDTALTTIFNAPA